MLPDQMRCANITQMAALMRAQPCLLCAPEYPATVVTCAHLHNEVLAQEGAGHAGSADVLQELEVPLEEL